MQNFPFNTGSNNYQSYQPQTAQPNYGGYSNQYNPPPSSMNFSVIEGRMAVDNYLVGTNVTAILADFTNMKLYIKERDANNILKPLREFNLSEVIQQQPTPQVNAPQVQNDERFTSIQNEMNELKQMFQSFMSSQNTQLSNGKPNNKGGNK